MPGRSYPVAIIGAGPAGLSLALHLNRLGVESVVLEAGRVGNTWRNVPPQLTLLNDWWLCALTRGGLFHFPMLSRVGSRDMLAHLERLIRGEQLNIRECHRVTNVCSGPRGGYEIHFADNAATIQSRLLVCASGYYAKPYFPDLDSDGSIESCHSADISNYQKIQAWGASREKLLIVGKRVSAGQLITVAAQAGCEVHLSANTPIEFSSVGWRQRFYEKLYFFYEHLRFWLQPERRGNSYPGMDGGPAKLLVESGKVPVHPRLVGIRNGRVEFPGGQHERFDRVIFATGYRPCIDYLKGLPSHATDYRPDVLLGLEHRDIPNLFFLGFDNARSFRSRYFRGIRADAKWLAKRVENRLRAAG